MTAKPVIEPPDEPVTGGARQPRTDTYLLLMAGAALIVLAGLILDPGAAAFSTHSQYLAALWYGLLLLAEGSPLPIAPGGARLSLTPLIEFGGLLTFGPGGAILLSGAGRLTSGLARSPRRLARMIEETSVQILGLGAAGWVGGRLGWVPGVPPVQEVAVLPALACMSLAAFAVWFGVPRLAGLLRPQVVNARAGDRPSTFRDSLGFLLLPFGILLGQAALVLGLTGAGLFALPLLMARLSRRLWEETREAHLKTLRVCTTALDAFDPHTRGQAYRVSRLSHNLGRKLGLSEPELEQLEYAALLHDIGRTAIRQDVLLKRGALDAEESEMMQTHPRIGADIVKDLGFMAGAAELILCHHERPDGRGYPRGLSEAEAPRGARILMVAAAFDAMTRERPYRRGMTTTEACAELQRCSGSQFSSEVVTALLDLLARGELFDDFSLREVRLMSKAPESRRMFHQLVGDLQHEFRGPGGPTIELSDELRARLDSELEEGLRLDQAPDPAPGESSEDRRSA